jgi:16S rRNA (uracil1498-N3)-methyltransferase
MIDRFFVSGELKAGGTVEMLEKEYHHLANVMRAKVGDVVELINGRGDLAKALVTEIKKKQASLKVTKTEHHEKPDCSILLAQAIPRSQKIDFIIEKGTELGVTEFWFFPGIKSEKQKISPHRLKRAETLAVSALKQCGRLWLPEIQVKPILQKWETPPFPFYYGDISKSAPLFQEAWVPNKKAGFCVGPESGFANSEMKQLERLGVKGVKLNPNILRTETAALLSVGIIAHWILQ